MKFLSPKAKIDSYLDTTGAKYIMAAIIIAPPVVLFDGGRHLYFQLANIVSDEMLWGHKYIFMLSRFEEYYHAKYHTEHKLTFPSWLYIIRNDVKLVPSLCYKKEEEFMSAIKNYGEPLERKQYADSIIPSYYELKTEGYNVSDAFIASIFDENDSPLMIGCELESNNPLLSKKEFVNIDIHYFRDVLKDSFSLMKQAVNEKLNSNSSINQTSMWGELPI